MCSIFVLFGPCGGTPAVAVSLYKYTYTGPLYTIADGSDATYNSSYASMFLTINFIGPAAATYVSSGTLTPVTLPWSATDTISTLASGGADSLVVEMNSQVGGVPTTWSIIAANSNPYDTATNILSSSFAGPAGAGTSFDEDLSTQDVVGFPGLELGDAGVATDASGSWTVVPYVSDDNLLWSGSGDAIIWTLDSSDNYVDSIGFGPYSGWTPTSYVPAPDGTARLLWSNTNGAVIVWKLDSSGNFVSSTGFGPYSGWTPTSYVFASDGTARLMWSNTDGAAIIWTLDSSNNYVSSVGFGPYPGWTPSSYE